MVAFVNFIFALVFFLQNYNIAGYNSMLLVVPMRSILIIFLFSLLDTIQDIIASVGSLKFSNFSYMFALGGESWHSKHTGAYFVHVYLVYMCAIASQGGFMILKKNSTSMGNYGVPFTTKYSHPGCSAMHI
jgi:hypothetical protein